MLLLFNTRHCSVWIDATVAGGLLYDKRQSSVAHEASLAPVLTGGFAGAPTWLWSWNPGIPVASRQREAAKTFAAWATPKDDVSLVAKGNGEVAAPPGTRQSNCDDPEKEVGPFAAFAEKAIDNVHAEGQTREPPSHIGVRFVAIPELQDIGTQVGQTTAAPLTGRSTVDRALAAAQSATERTMRHAVHPKT